MRAYMAYMGEPQDCAVLVLAESSKAARKMAWPCLIRLLDGDFIDLRVQWLKNADMAFLTSQYAAPGVHARLPSCRSCECWFPYELTNERCEGCHEEYEDDQELQQELNSAHTPEVQYASS